MRFGQIATRFLPAAVKRQLILSKEIATFNYLKKENCDLDNLIRNSEISVNNVFNSLKILEEWKEIDKKLVPLNVPDGTGGVNPGDRRAIYYLITSLKPTSVLEIGTHIGASTIHIAAALCNSQIADGKTHELTTVDIRDVNSLEDKVWENYGMAYSPLQMIEKLGFADFVDFVADTSLQYAASSNKKFDFIFLDGDHSATTVYKEIPVALRLLKDNGVILLHDYFPNLKPLWSNGSVIRGISFSALPLGELPWPTKLQSNVTSLALLLKD